MPSENLFPHLWRHVCELEERRRAAWDALTSVEAIVDRQRWIRDTVRRMIGPFPPRSDLNARVVGGFARDGYRVETVIFDSRPGFPVTATLYLPEGDPPFPAVVSPCGHSANGRMYDVYQRAHIAFAKAGFVCLSYDPVSQGERVQYLDDAGKPVLAGCCHEHCMAGNQANLTGGNMANLRIWDGIRALDYLLTRPEVDPGRVAVTGNSGGGTLSTYLLCLDERYAAGAPCCYITTLVHRIATRMAADSEQQFVPMLLEGIDHPDLLLPAAPKPVLIGAATRDFFPIEGARRTADDLRRIYDILGRPEAVGLCETNDTHGWNQELREGVTRWFRRWLQEDTTPYAEPPITTEPDETLWATTSGQVMTAGLGAAHVHEIVQRDFPVRLSCRSERDPIAATRAALPRLLGIDPAAARRPWPSPEWAVIPAPLPPGPPGVRVEPVEFRSDFDVTVRGLLFRPMSASETTTLLLPDEQGIAPFLARDSLAYRLAAGGSTVLAIDPRGVGADLGGTPARVPASHYHDFYGTEVDLTYTSWMIGRPLLGMRVFDALCGAEWLRRFERPVAVVGVGVGGLLALLAAALDPELVEVKSEGMLVSWSALFAARTYDYLPNILLPDALLHCDLPDIAATIAPRPLTVRAPVDAGRRCVGQDQLLAEYRVAIDAYDAWGAGEQLTLCGDGSMS